MGVAAAISAGRFACRNAADKRARQRGIALGSSGEPERVNAPVA
jgi:hypothetical protein